LVRRKNYHGFNQNYMSPIKTKRQECQIYSRVNGWYTPTCRWNRGKRSEYADRKTYNVEK
jgi:anaerobic ribonucleoside-triphosphate reductase